MAQFLLENLRPTQRLRRRPFSAEVSDAGGSLAARGRPATEWLSQPASLSRSDWLSSSPLPSQSELLSQGVAAESPLSSWGETLAPLAATGLPAWPSEPVPVRLLRSSLELKTLQLAARDSAGGLSATASRLVAPLATTLMQVIEASGDGLPPALCSCSFCLGAPSSTPSGLLARGSRFSMPRPEPAQPPPAAVRPLAPSGAPTAPGTPVASSLVIADGDVFNLETNPGAAKTIYLNFVGANLLGTNWIPAGSTWDGNAPAFSLDADTTTFSAAERAAIKEIFARIACDYAPFNVNVTTKAPSIDRINRSSLSDSVYGTVCLFSNISSQLGRTGGGVAYLGVFDGVNQENLKPALVFPDRLANFAKYIAEAGSHEVGHNFNLNHDGTVATATQVRNEYYGGSGSGPGWAPIMGVGYYEQLTQFSRGTYSLATNTENDFARIAAEGVAPWGDTVGNDIAAAKSLALTDANGDGISDRLQLGGAIELVNSSSGLGLGTPDRDVYSFLAPSIGSVTINVRNALYYFDPAAAQYTFAPVPSGFGNLRLDVRLEDASGSVLADWSNNASLDVTNFSVSGLTGGQNYYLSVFANASSPDGEDTYGSLGDYVLDLVYQGQPLSPGLPSVSVALAPTSVLENSGQSLVYTFTRSGSTEAALSIAYTLAGSAAADDYSGGQPGADTLQFGVGADTATLTLTPVADSLVEADETVTLSLVSGSGYTLASPASATGTIRNDDLPPSYSLSGATSVSEGQPLTIGITTTNVANGTSLNWRFTGTGITATDVSPEGLTGTVTVNGGAAALPLTVAADNAIEATETALFELLSGGTVVASRSISLLDTNRRWGTTGSDTIAGTANRFECITGVLASGTGTTDLGAQQIDIVTGGLGSDEFLLSETRSGSLRVFYNDGSPKKNGLSDYLRVLDFNAAEDKLRFASGRYFSRVNGSDTQIWWDRSGNGALNTANNQNSSDEMIALLTGVNLGDRTIISGATTNPAWVVFG